LGMNASAVYSKHSGVGKFLEYKRAKRRDAQEEHGKENVKGRTSDVLQTGGTERGGFRYEKE